jgi:hypothetical protein
VTGDELTGRWSKVSGDPCSSSYPDRLELQAGGRYEGHMLPGAREHPRWDVGTFSQEASGALAISTSNDAIMRCTVTLEGDRLTLTDPEGCTFSYRRAG